MGDYFSKSGIQKEIFRINLKQPFSASNTYSFYLGLTDLLNLRD
jgi:hypothetical protein